MIGYAASGSIRHMLGYVELYDFFKPAVPACWLQLGYSDHLSRYDHLQRD